MREGEVWKAASRQGGKLNLRFIGDALDHWKGSLFECLQRKGVVQNFAVDPMASDVTAWNAEVFKTYACLLRVRVGQIIRHRATPQDREKYFEEILHKGDIFLDPDTGIATGRAGITHVSPKEIVLHFATSDVLIHDYKPFFSRAE